MDLEVVQAFKAEQWMKLYQFLCTEFPDQVGPHEGALEFVFRLLRELKNRRTATPISPLPAPSMEEVIRHLQDSPEFAKLKVSQEDAIVAKVLERLKASPEFAALQISAEKPELSVTVQRKVIDVDGSTLRGRLAQMVAEGWFNDPMTGNAAYNELQRRGFGTAKPNVYRELDKLAEWGFLTKESSGGYQAVQGMKVNIREVA
jgi:hypothetical protein